METTSEFTLREKIIAVQKQFRIAVQNHQALVAKKQILQTKDDKIKVHLDVIQFLILNMGKTQASLLQQFRNEIAAKHDLQPNCPTVTNLMKNILGFPEIKDIPIYKKSCHKGDSEEKGSSVKTKMKSVLKVNNNIDLAKSRIATVEGSKIKIVFNKKKDSLSVVPQQTKPLQSILKSKSQKININDKKEKNKERSLSPLSESSMSSVDSKEKGSPPRIGNPNEEMELADSLSSNLSSRIDTRYGKRYEAKMIGSTKVKISCDQIIKRDTSGCLDSKDTCPTITPRYSTPGSTHAGLFGFLSLKPSINTRKKILDHKLHVKLKHLDQNPCHIDELDQESFLGIFRLVSNEKCEILKRKKCERKRRSVAGQSSLYSDYFQPQPKRTYGPRKPAVPINTNAVIVESQIADDDDDEKQVKSDVCIFCHEEGNLEVCNSCSEMYHFQCIPNAQKGNCPTCMAQWTNIPSIVGANTAGNVSNIELIKRYSCDDTTTEHSSPETN